MRQLKVDLDKGFISAQGSIIDIATDVLVVISEVYATTKKRDAAAAELFRKCIEAGVSNPDSPCFDGRSLPGMALCFRMDKA